MNQFVPDWGNMGDTSRPLGEDDDLMELLWCNGHVVMQSQTHRKLPQRPEKAAAAQEDEAGLWFPFALADSLDKDIFSDLFCEAPGTVTVAGVDGGKPGRDATTGDDNRGDACSVSEAPRDLMPPPKSTHVSGSRQQTMSLTDGGDNAGDLSDLVQARTGAAAGKAAMEEGSSSMLSAIGASICASICGSNQVQVQRAASEQGRAGRVSDTARGSIALPSAVGSGNANARGGRGHEATVASSSGRSNGCFDTTTTTTEPASTSNRSSKRKRLDTEDSESPSEGAESGSAALEPKPPQKLTTARRSRAAQVHNLSERRRRDRINEKMRALQELIPHCNKTDKASMLDEAIEYLKSLQMQVQMMWMGSGITPPVMFPSMHQYLPQMGPSMPRMAPAFMAAPQPVVPSALQGHAASPGYHHHHHHHMPGAVSLPEHYAHFLGVNHQYAQGVGYYPSLGGGGKTAAQQNPTLHVPVAGIGSGSTPAATANAHAPAPGGGALPSLNATHPNIRSG